MRPIVVDTNAYAAFKAGETSVLDVVAHADRLLMTSVVLGELLAGFAAGTRQAQNRAELAAFMESPRVEVVAITAQTADSYALVYAALRRKGQPIPTNVVDSSQCARARCSGSDPRRALRKQRRAACGEQARRLSPVK